MARKLLLVAVFVPVFGLASAPADAHCWRGLGQCLTTSDSGSQGYTDARSTAEKHRQQRWADDAIRRAQSHPPSTAGWSW
jgi:hypothetical protein